MGDFHHDILQYYVTRHANFNIKFCNCGIAGDTVSGALTRLSDDVFVHNPSHAFIMFGMNDLGKDYNKSMATREEDIKTDLNNYEENLEQLIAILQEKNVSVALARPSIYDQTAVLKTPNMIGRNDILYRASLIISEIADKRSLQVVDFFSILKSLNSKLQAANPSDSIIGTDRIHPGPVGHLVMAYKFLTTLQKPSPIASIVLDTDVESSCALSYNAKVVSMIRRPNHEIETVIIEYALPFVLDDKQRKAAQLVAFGRDFNTETFLVRNLSKIVESYRIIIDGVKIGIFKRESLEAGISLALKRTPQYSQGDKVRIALLELWRIEQMERNVKFVEFSAMKQFFKDHSQQPFDLNAASAFLNQTYEKQHSGNTFIRKSFDAYIQNKPLQAMWKESMEIALALARKQAAPVQRTFIIRPAAFVKGAS